MAEGGVLIIRFTYTGAEGEIIPREATHITVGGDVTFVREEAFADHPNIFEVIFHENVEKIEERAFWCCFYLRRVIMPGVKIIETNAFNNCPVLTDVECGKLERIGTAAFGRCKSLRSIHIPSARIVEWGAFNTCESLVDAKFGATLERFEKRAFTGCPSLEQITIPLKDGVISRDDIFYSCHNLRHVDLVEGELHETITALHLNEWKNDVHEEIDSINRILPNTPAGYHDEEDYGGKALVIQTWIRAVLDKIEHYKAEHQRVLNEATTLLELAIWKANLDDADGSRIVREGVRTTRGSVKRARREICITSGASIVIKNVLPFLQLK